MATATEWRLAIPIAHRFAATLAILLLAAQPARPEFRAGRGQARITPQGGVPMAGYYNVRLAEGTHDDLYAKALVIEESGMAAALVVCDLVALEAETVDATRALIEKQSGIGGERVLLSATHSHTGPLMRRQFLALMDPQAQAAAKQYLAVLPERIAESVRIAVGNLAPARISAAAGSEPSLSFNRRFLMKDGTIGWNPGKLNPAIVQPAGPTDPEVAVVSVDAADGKPLAVLVNYALHLDTTGGLQYSADYPFTLGRILAKFRGADLLTLFSIGAAGDVNHIDVSSKAPQKGFGEATRIGTVLAGEVIKTSTRLNRIAEGKLNVAREVVPLPLAPIEPDQAPWARRMAARMGKPNPPDFLTLVKAFQVLDVAARDRQPIPGEVQVMALGKELAIVALPGEVFTELGIAIKKASPFPLTIVQELSGGWIGYVPSRRAYPQGAYEVISARCGAGSGELLVDAAVRLLTNVYQRAR